ncbi:DUF3467 domain-containing protein [Methanosphaera sp. WGK6]|uniref:DUF3467 domain-containing protein n=1 Tax=Methanosphaera sp. WGK6 TaxID=1561964 RepID=UPI00084C83A2|nr:DUF3467 domain-containing protein [Methanosphaera sp. WGK6]OED29895.1 hypothetical protein NL43_05645 [Methanosphaera sp. WGK6]
MNEENIKQNNILIPEDLPEIHITGCAVASTPYNIRLILFNEELEKTGDISDTLELFKTAKAEVIMHPAVAKQVADLLNNAIENYEKNK